MDAVDKEIGSMTLFNTREDRYAEDNQADGFNDGGKLSDITSVQQLKHLLKNYDSLVEGQHHLLTQSIHKMQKIPPPEEITATFNRF
jgi:hypothetical protein